VHKTIQDNTRKPANAKVSERQQRVCIEVPSEEIYTASQRTEHVEKYMAEKDI